MLMLLLSLLLLLFMCTLIAGWARILAVLAVRSPQQRNRMKWWHCQMIIAYLLLNNINLLRSSISLKFIQSDMRISWFRVCSSCAVCGECAPFTEFSIFRDCECARVCVFPFRLHRGWNETGENTWNNNHNKNYRISAPHVPSGWTCNYCYIIQFSIHTENRISAYRKLFGCIFYHCWFCATAAAWLLLHHQQDQEEVAGGPICTNSNYK